MATWKSATEYSVVEVALPFQFLAPLAPLPLCSRERYANLRRTVLISRQRRASRGADACTPFTSPDFSGDR
ncbi:MAG: hypothetical protein AAGG53_00660 [Cyanobacteria bacterium P01_H01_bin.152]